MNVYDTGRSTDSATDGFPAAVSAAVTQFLVAPVKQHLQVCEEVELPAISVRLEQSSFPESAFELVFGRVFGRNLHAYGCRCYQSQMGVSIGQSLKRDA
jgi:hypothetical protein